jgi:NADH dehydrogenase/NADH:ubiquinone oxidoreductase subunit G
MAHVSRSLQHMTDPDTGRRYPIPAGGAEEGDGAAEGEAGGEGEGEAADETSGAESKEADAEEDGEGAGSKNAVLADLKRERTRRQAAESNLAKAMRKNESDTDTREREIRESAQAPAIRALRVTAVETAARAAGFYDPADAAALLNLSTLEVDLEADLPSADRKTAEDLVKDLAKLKPHLIMTGETPGKAKGGSDAQSTDKTISQDPNVTLRLLARKRLGMSG